MSFTSKCLEIEKWGHEAREFLWKTSATEVFVDGYHSGVMVASIHNGFLLGPGGARIAHIAHDLSASEALYFAKLVELKKAGK